jgi:hypothetical protein
VLEYYIKKIKLKKMEKVKILFDVEKFRRILKLQKSTPTSIYYYRLLSAYTIWPHQEEYREIIIQFISGHLSIDEFVNNFCRYYKNAMNKADEIEIKILDYVQDDFYVSEKATRFDNVISDIYMNYLEEFDSYIYDVDLIEMAKSEPFIRTELKNKIVPILFGEL